MKTKRILTIGFMSLAILAVSCKKDKEKPTIKLESPAAGAEFKPGETINFKATFSDNEALKEYKLDIHEGGDHSHGKTTDIYDEWDYEKVGELSGTEKTIELSIVIPADLELDTAEHHTAFDLVLECTDEEGNEADLVDIEFEIHDE
ncbi:MAG: DUF4625 domain-containing protein [Flavobacteriales bacterium]|nr:DUF4625 domain-containing protein [Flavobacteriales bacterium]